MNIDQRPFIIYGLPRSRTKWLSEFLSYDGWHVGHDLPVRLHSVVDLQKWFAMPKRGSCETAMVEYWPLIRKLVPGIVEIVVLRPQRDVISSLRNIHGPLGEYDIKDIERRSSALMDLCADCGASVYRWDFLDNDHANLDMLFRDALGVGLPEDHWRAFKDRNIQINWAERQKNVALNWQAINHVRAEAESLMAGDNIIIEPERWAKFFPDAWPLMQAHYDEVVHDPRIPLDPWTEMIERLDRDNIALFMGARHHGRMVGYAVFVISPNVMSRGIINADQKIFYVDPAFRGTLSKRLFREGLRQLHMRGVKMVIPHHWLTGDARRDAVEDRFFESLGAVKYETEFMLFL